MLFAVRAKQPKDPSLSTKGFAGKQAFHSKSQPRQSYASTSLIPYAVLIGGMRFFQHTAKRSYYQYEHLLCTRPES